MVTAPVIPWVLSAIVVTGVVHGYLFVRLIKDCGWRARLLRPLSAGLIFLSLLLPAGMLGLLYMRVLPRVHAQPLMTTAFTYVGVLYFLLMILLWLEVQGLLFGRMAPRRRAGIAGAFTVVFSTLALMQGLRSVPTVTTRVTLNRLPAALEGYKIVHLSDLHVGATLGRAFVADIVEKANRAQPNLVVITGDLVDGTPAQLGAELAPLAELRASDGVFLTLGNHEFLSEEQAWCDFLPSLHVRVLRNESVPIGAALELIGIDDLVSVSASQVTTNLASAFARRDPQRFSIVLVHEPSALPAVQARAANLQLSGHTHGGQIVPLQLLAWLNESYLAGLYQLGETRLHVSPGAGFWGPPMRLGSRAEISLLVLSAH